MVENGGKSQGPAALVKMFERAVRYGLRGCARRHRKATLERKFVHGVDLAWRSEDMVDSGSLSRIARWRASLMRSRLSEARRSAMCCLSTYQAMGM